MSNNSVPGLMLPQEKPMLAGNPKDSAIAANNQSITKQSDLIKATSGGNRNKRNNNNKSKRNKKYKYGGASSGATNGEISVPQYQMPYTSTGASGQTPNDIIKQNTSISTQGSANAEYDNLAKKGGSKKRKRGGNSNWTWGCYSGGRKKSKKHANKRKTYKKRRNSRRK
jgi:hypothetical protein